MARLSQRAPPNEREEINLGIVLEAVGQGNVDVDFNRRGFRRKLLRDLARARSHYNTCLDLRNKSYLERLDGKLAKVVDHCRNLARLLSEKDLLAELHSSVTELQCSLDLLAERAGDRRREINERIKIASSTWRKGSSQLALSSELVAYLVIVFEENFGTPHGYAHAIRENARANTCGRFIKTVFSEFGLGNRGINTIRNDLIKASSRIQRLRERRTKTRSESQF